MNNILLLAVGTGLLPPDTSADLEPAYDRRHVEDLFHGPNWTWLYPTSMGAPEFTPYIADEIVDTEECMVRRPERDVFCLRRTDEDTLALRRAPECPEQLACSNQGCV